jgi:tetratricopeptide (TPR) repeat protein
VSEPLHSRYPGTSPFDDSPEDVSRFFGRDEEAEELYLRVLSVPLLVQFGMSGLGKTSLVQAGLFPRLRQKPFLPVMVRLNDPGDTLLEAVIRSMRKSCEIEGLQFVPGTPAGLWELLASTTIFRDDLLLTPVLVFDQFEEVFTLRDADFRAEVAAELGAIAAGIPPARIEATHKPRRQNVKIVISLREDYVGSLEEFSAAIPGLFQERLRLEPFTERAARDAVTRPALLAGAFDSPRFELEPAALDALIQYLRGRSGVIEPIQLQLLSRHAEGIARKKPKQDVVRLKLDDFRGKKQSFASVLENFYRDTLRKIPPVQRKHAARLCEEGLLDSEGHRLMLEERQIQREFGVRPETLGVLTQEKLVRREQRLESVFYEISHDRLAESVFNARHLRIPKSVKQALWIAAAAALLVFGLLSYFSWRVSRERNSAEELIGFLIGEQFLGEVRDMGSSTLLEQVQEHLDHGAASEDRPSKLRGLALRGRGDVKRLQGDVAEATRFYRQALNTFDKEDSNTLREIARTQERLGVSLEQEQKLEEALAPTTAADVTWRRVVAGVPDPVQRLEDCVSSADSLVTTGLLRERLGQGERALQDAGTAVGMISNVLFGAETATEHCGPVPDKAEPYPDPDAIRVLSRAALLQAMVLGRPEDYEGAAALAREARELMPASTSMQEYALEALSWRAYGTSDTNAQRAYGDYRLIQQEAEELRRADPDNRLWQRERAIALEMVGRGIGYCHRSGNCHPMPPLEEAEAVILEGIATLRALAQLDPRNVSLQGDIFWALLDQVDVLALEPERAAERLDALKHAEETWKKLRPDAQTRTMLEELRARQAGSIIPVAHAEPVPPESKAQVSPREAIRRWPSDAAGYTRMMKAKRELVAKTKDPKEQAALHNAVLQAAQIAAWLSPGPMERTELLVARLEFGSLLQQQQRAPEALAMMTEGVAGAEHLAGESPDAAEFHGLLGVFKVNVGLIRRTLKRDGWEEAVRGGLLHIQKAATLKPENYYSLAVYQQFLGASLIADGRKNEGEIQYRLALESYRKVPPDHNPDQTREAIQQLMKLTAK